MKTLVQELRSWIGFPKKDLDILLENAADEIERLQTRLRVARNIIVDAKNFIHPTAVWRDTDLMQRNIDRFLADGRTPEPNSAHSHGGPPMTLRECMKAEEPSACDHDLESPYKTLKATLAPRYGWRCTVCDGEWYPEKSGEKP